MRLKRNAEHSRLRTLYRQDHYVFRPALFMRGYHGAKTWKAVELSLQKSMLVSSFHDGTTDAVITCHAMGVFYRER